MNKSASKLFVFLLIFMICGNYLKFGHCFKCEFKDSWTYFCDVRPDSSSIEGKHYDGITDDNVKRINFNGTLNGISHLTQSELAPICQRFKNIDEVHVYAVKSVDENLFQQCGNLRLIYITKTEIEEISEKIFFEHPNLNKIGISGSKLRTLPENVFLNQKELKMLGLNSNQISYLPSNIFKSLTKLKSLWLYSNKIQFLNPKWFENLQSLSKLYLNDNKIQDLPKNVFTNLRKLEVLHLYENQLTIIHADSFGSLRKLQWIGLDSNKIIAFDEKIIDNTAVIFIFMEGNICMNKEIVGRDKLKEELINCINNYQPRMESTVNIECGTRSFVRGMIHHGAKVSPGEYPWNVALIEIEDNQFFCGGTIISKRHILTAAHCIKGKYDSHVFGPGDFHVLLGVHNWVKSKEEGRVVSSVSSIIIHHHWNINVQIYDADIAVLKLSAEIQFNNFIRPICLINENSPIAQVASGTVVGFGLTETGLVSNVARKLEIPIRDYQNCTVNDTNHRYVASARTFCGGPADGTGVCDGDSGGGVYVKHNGLFYLRGVVSSSLVNNDRECDTKQQAIFTDVPQYYDWIKHCEKMRKRN